MWEVRGGEKDSIPESPMSLPRPIWEALYNRSFDTIEKLENLFSPKLSQIRNPFELKNMDLAVDRILEALDKKQKIAIYADFDLDGTTGLCLLYDALIELKFENVVFYQPLRLSEGYGLHVHAIEDLKSQNVDVIITVDVGITAIDAALKAKELDIDLIITDHHLPYDQLPEAYAIVNPNLKNCSSGLGFLSGAGVAFYLVLAIRSKLKKENKNIDEFDPKKLLDLFVIGTLTDLVPLVLENRVLIKHGLNSLQETQRVGLRALMLALNLVDRPLTSHDVAIQLAPKLNALSRMEVGLYPRDILLEKNAEKADEMVQKILEIQELRKSVQKIGLNKAEELKIEMNQEGYIWVWSQDFHKGVIGLIATQLSQKFAVPTFIGSVEGDKISGSCRIPEGGDGSLAQILSICSSSLISHGGHSMAAGFSLKIHDAITFDEQLRSYFLENPVIKKTNKIEYDSLANIEDFSPHFMKWYLSLEPFGKDFSSLKFCVKKVMIQNLRPLNGGHLKIMWDQNGFGAESVMFSPKNPGDFILGQLYDLIVEPQWNYFNNQRKLQLVVHAYKRI